VDVWGKGEMEGDGWPLGWNSLGERKPLREKRDRICLVLVSGGSFSDPPRDVVSEEGAGEMGRPGTVKKAYLYVKKRYISVGPNIGG